MSKSRAPGTAVSPDEPLLRRKTNPQPLVNFFVPLGNRMAWLERGVREPDERKKAPPHCWALDATH